MNYINSANAIRDRLFSLLRKGIKLDLNRMFKAASLCGDPQKAYKTVHVAGTNGKGSTCTYIESVLRAAGYRTGLYTSPYICNLEEQFKIDGVMIKDDVWLDVYIKQEKIINEIDLSFFEAITLMAFEIFRRSEVHYAVFETGMGGRLDATNIITPQVSVITKIAFDHMDYLGNTLVQIAEEKLGIVKPEVPLVMVNPVDKNIRQLAEMKCRETGSKLTFVNSDNVDGVECDSDGVSFNWNNHRYDLSLFGIHQVQNATLALNALKKIADFNYGVLYDGMKHASLSGRFQIMNVVGRTVVIDVGHNPDAAESLIKAIDLRFHGKSILFIVGMMKDKDTSSVIKILAKSASTFYFTKPQTERVAIEAAGLYTIADGFGFRGRCVVEQNVEEALYLAIKEAHPTNDVICVTGSFYTVAEAFKVLDRVKDLKSKC